jgi:hypothetical protein
MEIIYFDLDTPAFSPNQSTDRAYITMIEFVLDVISDFSLAITSYTTSDLKSDDIRAFIAFYDSIKEIEIESEHLITSFKVCANSSPDRFKPSTLRASIRVFSLSIYRLVEKFREFGFRKFGIPLEIFNREIAESLVTVGLMKSVFCRSLLEISSPDICFNQSLPSIEQKYCLRVIDYKKYNYSMAAVQKRWNCLFTYFGIPNLLWRDKPFNGKITDAAITTKSGEKWVSEEKNYDLYSHQHPILKREEVEINESFIRLMLDFKIFYFTDIPDIFELKEQIWRDEISLQRLRENRVKLAAFLTNHFSISDFF